MKETVRPLRLLSIFLLIVVTASPGVTGLHVVAFASSTTRFESASSTSSNGCVCGPRQVSLLLFDFQDLKHNASNSPATYTRIVQEMNASFYTQSYGKMWLVGGKVYGWYDSTLHLADFEKSRGWVHFMPDYQGMRLENVALNKSQSLGLTGYVVAVFAGPIWSWADYNRTIAVQAESDGLEFFMHEFGHLIGLTDLQHELMQGWDLMDSNTTELSAWSRIQLGWLTGDAIVSASAAKPVSVLVNLIDVPTGIRAVKIQTLGWIGYYMAETRLTAGYGLSLLVYSVSDTGNGGGIPGEFRAIMPATVDWNRVLIRNEFAIIILDKQKDSIKVNVTTKEIGVGAQTTTETLQSASTSIQSALLSNRTQGLSDAQEQLDKAWQAYHTGDFATAESLAENAKSLATASTIPKPGSEFSSPMLVSIVAAILLVLVSVVLLLRKRSRMTKTKS